jgi:prepilin-type N-terminal cleavage/methylation domain-containing protein
MASMTESIRPRPPRRAFIFRGDPKNSGVTKRARIRSGGPAFSLIELLVVLAIIGVLVVVGVRVMGDSTGGAVQGASDLGVAAIEMARRASMAEQQGARVVMDADPQSECFLRRLVVVRKKSDGGWIMEARPQVLPSGAFLYPSYLKGAQDALFDFRSGSFEDGGKAWFYEFDGSGKLLLPEGVGQAQIVFVAGLLSQTAPFELTVPEKRETSKQGFVMRKSGAVNRFESPEQITN